MSELVDMLLSGVGIVGNVLDTPGALVRNSLSGRNPFSGLNPFDSEGRASGRDMLESWGALDANEEGLDWGDVAGFGAELVTDPLNFMGLGAARKTATAAREAAEFNAKAASRIGEVNSMMDAIHLPPGQAEAYNAIVEPRNAASMAQRAARWFPEENIPKTALAKTNYVVPDEDAFWKSVDDFNAMATEKATASGSYEPSYLGLGEDTLGSWASSQYESLASGEIMPEEFQSLTKDLISRHGGVPDWMEAPELSGIVFSSGLGSRSKGLQGLGEIVRVGEIDRDNFARALLGNSFPGMDSSTRFRKSLDEVVSEVMSLGDPHGALPDVVRHITEQKTIPKLYHGSPYAGRFDPWSIDMDKSSSRNLYAGSRGHYATTDPVIAAGGGHHSYAMGATQEQIPLIQEANAEVQSLTSRLRRLLDEQASLDDKWGAPKIPQATDMSQRAQQVEKEIADVSRRIDEIQDDPTLKDWAPGAHIMYADYQKPWNMEEEKSVGEWLGDDLAKWLSPDGAEEFANITPDEVMFGSDVFSYLSSGADDMLNRVDAAGSIEDVLNSDAYFGDKLAEKFAGVLKSGSRYPKTSDELATDLLKSLGYDSILHTGGTRMGRGMGPGNLHQVAINILDEPGQAYYKPFIAPQLEVEMVPHPGHLSFTPQDVPSNSPLLSMLLGHNALARGSQF